MFDRGFVTYSNAAKTDDAGRAGPDRRGARRGLRSHGAGDGGGRGEGFAARAWRWRSPASPARAAAAGTSRSGWSISPARRRWAANGGEQDALRRHRPRCDLGGHGWPACRRRWRCSARRWIRPGLATAVRRRAVQGLGARLETGDQPVAGAIEIGAEQGVQQPGFELEIDLKKDFCSRGMGFELPAIRKPLERPPQQGDQDLAIRGVAANAGGETAPSGRRSPTASPRRRARRSPRPSPRGLRRSCKVRDPGHELRVPLDVADQGRTAGPA